MDDSKAEFWGDLQKDYYTETSTLFLANQTLESVISTNGSKAHKVILSNPSISDYTPYADITFDRKTATKQTLTVNNYVRSSEEIDVVDEKQTPYDLIGHASGAIRAGLINRTEQVYLSQIANAGNVLNSGNAFQVTPDAVLPMIEEASGILGALDMPTATAGRVAVFGPRTIAAMRRNRAERETALGDSVSSNGVIGAWQGWTFVQNNNLPWSATLTLAVLPTNLDKVTFMGRVFEFRTTLGTGTAGTIGVLIGAAVANSRTNLKNAIEGLAGTVGTDFQDPDSVTKLIVRNKRRVRATISGNDLLFTGFGDVLVNATLTSASNFWSNERQQSVFMQRGAIDLVMQLMEIDVASKEKGFAKLVKGLVGVGAQMFEDGKLAAVRVNQDITNWRA